MSESSSCPRSASEIVPDYTVESAPAAPKLAGSVTASDADAPSTTGLVGDKSLKRFPSDLIETSVDPEPNRIAQDNKVRNSVVYIL